VEKFITKINTRLRKIDEEKELLRILDEFEEYNTWSAGNEDVMWVGCTILYFASPPAHSKKFLVQGLPNTLH